MLSNWAENLIEGFTSMKRQSIWDFSACHSQLESRPEDFFHSFSVHLLYPPIL